MFLWTLNLKCVSTALAADEKWSALESQEKGILWFAEFCLPSHLPREAGTGKTSLRAHFSQVYSSRLCLKIWLHFRPGKALFCFFPFSSFILMKPETNVCFVLSSFLYPAAIQVEITPPQGEISVGESKFFLCEGNLQNISCNTARSKCYLT